MNYSDAFKLLDKSSKGVLTCKEFCAIRSIIELSVPILQGLFAVMDKQGIGLVDF